MRKLNLLILILFAISSYSCQQKTNAVKNSYTQTKADNAHSSKNSLDWQGVYQGILPCADCEGIQTTLEIYREGKYKLSAVYLGKSENVFMQSGDFGWNDEGNTIMLSNIQNSPSKYFVGENNLIQLDMDGNRITGNLADKYILNKQSPKVSEAKSLEESKWVLVEIMGKAVESNEESRSNAFIVFKAEAMRVHGNGSCNTFNGTYELQEGYRIKFSKIASTMMACPDLTIEQQLFKVLETADNYTIADGILSLNKARMASLAKFSAVEK